MDDAGAARRTDRDELVRAQKSDLVGRLAGGLNHDLNNQLTSISAFAQLVQTNPTLPDDVRRDAQLGGHEADRALALLRGLFDFLRERPPERHQTRIGPLIEAVRQLLAYELARHQATLDVRIPEQLPAVAIDRQQIEQALLTLTLVAIRETGRQAEAGDRSDPRGQSEAVVTIEAGHAGDSANDAAGGEVLRLRIAPMPVRRQPAEAPEGLNDDADDPDFLAVRAICEQHAGRLRLLEDRGGFSAVVELPVGVGRGPAAQDAGSAAPPMPAPPGAASRVMVVDDDPAVRRFLERAVRLSGLDVVGTSSTAEAIELAADGSIGLVLCDQRLAGTTGVETYEALIAHRPDLAERFVLTTGDIDSDEVRRFSASTGAAILAKPFDLAAIGRLLARYRSE